MTTPHGVDGFAATVTFDSQEAVLALHGDTDPLTAPCFGSLLTALADGDHQQVVVDLSGAGSMGAAGVGVLASAAAQLGATGRVLTLRAAPPIMRRILSATGLSTLVNLEASGAGEWNVRPRRAGSAALAAVPESLSTMLAEDEAATDGYGRMATSLQMLSVLAAASLPGADGVSLAFAHNGEMTTRAASNDTVLRMDAHQYEAGEGPCLAAAEAGQWFSIDSLADEQRWPTFIPLAMEEGIASILSGPVLGTDRTLGSLNIYSSTERAFGPDGHDLAALFAAQAAVAIEGSAAVESDEDRRGRITQGLLSRGVVAQAQGVLMARRGITAEEAAASLYRSARAANLPLARLAAEIIQSTRFRGQEGSAGA